MMVCICMFKNYVCNPTDLLFALLVITITKGLQFGF